MNILLVEDDDWLAELYCDVLQVEGGYSVNRARTAEDALSLLDSHIDIQLIILDMFLPAHNGIEFLHEMASYTDLNEIPVVVLSSVYQHDFGMSEARWKHYGVVQYLYKPQTKPQDLLTTIKKRLVQTKQTV